MKLARLWQPHNPLFWVVVVLNALSTLLAWVVRTYYFARHQAKVRALYFDQNSEGKKRSEAESKSYNEAFWVDYKVAEGVVTFSVPMRLR